MHGAQSQTKSHPYDISFNIQFHSAIQPIRKVKRSAYYVNFEDNRNINRVPQLNTIQMPKVIYRFSSE